MNKGATRPGKRERLTEAAVELIHRQGVQATTLAEIAATADVPLGNVYYYFKTRDDLIEAVIAAYADQVQALIDGLEPLATPRERLKGLVEVWADQADLAAAQGCAVGSLSAELSKTLSGRDHDVSCLLGTIVDWAEAQLRVLGRSDSRELALALVGTVQGAAVLTNAMRDPEILRGQVRLLDEWIDSLA